jgi:Uma2 family endonuclease
MSKNIARKIEPILTIADLDSMPEDGNRYELIEGELFVSRAPSIRHQRILQNLQLLIGIYLMNNPIGVLVPGAGIVFDNFSGVIPDLIFVTHERYKEIISGDKFIDAPDLIVEILSPGVDNQRRDKNVKRHLYGERKLKEYWIIDPESATVEVYKLQKQGLKLVGKYINQDLLKSIILPNLNCKAEDIFKL